jgi:hypothetical protein
MIENLNLPEDVNKKLELFLINNTNWTKEQLEEFETILKNIISVKNGI